jgi:isoleucyl-tRNA synthetase
VAWTTTPWTLPSNLALCVNPDMDYVHFYGNRLHKNTMFILMFFLDNQRKKEFIILEARLPAMYKNPAKDIEVKAKLKGKELAGKKYTPLFNYFLKVFLVVVGVGVVLAPHRVHRRKKTGHLSCLPIPTLQPKVVREWCTKHQRLVRTIIACVLQRG